jgi:hypothetical protein
LAPLAHRSIFNPIGIFPAQKPSRKIPFFSPRITRYRGKKGNPNAVEIFWKWQKYFVA